MNFKTLLFSLSSISLAQAGDTTTSSDSLANAEAYCFYPRADSHAPIGVMGDHTHRKGEFMFSARTMFMRMEQNFMGTSSVNDQQVQAAGFGIVPADMDMQMHMLGLMYAPSDRVTLMAMVSYVEMSMNHNYGPGLVNSFKTESAGWGDASLSALVNLWHNDYANLHAGLGLLLPTAETDQTDLIPPAGGVRRLPYPMQLGSGSWGVAPSLTYNNQQPTWSYGAQASAKFLLDDNSQGYRLGDRYEATSWIAKPLNENFSASLRVKFSTWGDIDGNDPLIMGPVPTTRTDLRGGSKLDLSAGVNFFEIDNGLRAGLEVGKTLWQDLDGPQLASDYWVSLGLQFAW